MNLIRDASFAPMQNGAYQTFAIDCTNALNTLFKLRISIYPDDTGIIFSIDSNGNEINNRTVASFSYEYPHINAITGIPVPGIMTVTFDDNSVFINEDNNNTPFWYSIEGLEPFIIKPYV